MGSVNDELRDRAIRHALALNSYSQGLSGKVVRLLNGADQDIQDKLAARLAAIEERGSILSTATTKRLLALLTEVRAINAAVYGQVEDALTTELNQFAAGEADFQKSSLDTALGGDLGLSVPSPGRLRAIVTASPIDGTLLGDWFEGMESGRVDRISQAIRLGMVQGEGTDQIVRRVRGTKAAGYQDGVLNIGRNSAQTLVRTAVTHVSNQAAQETWAANSGVIKAWQFLATLDNRTTLICGSLDGTTYPIGEGPVPPRHLRCRSISVPVTKSFRELDVDADEMPQAKRASMDGQVSGGTTFSQWIKGKDAATQDKVLGKARADLLRSGKLDLQQFVRSDGTTITLKQLQSKYGDLLS